ncbi:MAG: prephenate dehydrogenase [Candidatus Omnitrophica bacterium]|nr:prephenate dehydrogenase [Candidatus Omnitrophota bacterium]
MKYRKVVIIGMGLIGGSIGKALIARKLAKEVIGVCRRKSSLSRAFKEKALTGGFVKNYRIAVKNADIIVIATPVASICNVLAELNGIVGPDSILTDAGSTKEMIVSCAAKYRKTYSFVGSHPLAGSEKTGVEFSESSLFSGSLCVVTRGLFTRQKDIEKIKIFWRALGAEVKVLAPHEHDEKLAFTSHLPHAIAYAMAGSMKNSYAPYAATGFKDTTRIASSDPVLWTSIFLSNPDNLALSMKTFKTVLLSIEKAIRNKDEKSLRKILFQCKGLKDAIG